MTRRTIFTMWIVLSLSILTVIWITLIRTAKAEFCSSKIDSSVERKAGYRWQWRTVDGKKCWYYSNNVLPREDLIWSFTEEEFNLDIDRVVERKFYKSVLDENQLLIERE